MGLCEFRDSKMEKEERAVRETGGGFRETLEGFF